MRYKATKDRAKFLFATFIVLLACKILQSQAKKKPEANELLPIQITRKNYFFQFFSVRLKVISVSHFSSVALSTNEIELKFVGTLENFCPKINGFLIKKKTGFFFLCETGVCKPCYQPKLLIFFCVTWWNATKYEENGRYDDSSAHLCQKIWKDRPTNKTSPTAIILSTSWISSWLYFRAFGMRLPSPFCRPHIKIQMPLALRPAI